MRTAQPPVIPIVVGVLALLFAATALLASFHHERLASRAAAHLQRGRSLATQQDLEAAAQEYRAALAIERGSPEATRELALTLLRLGRLSEAESYLGELLQQEPADGLLNRALARIHRARGEESNAIGSYQRAIYGQWPDDSGERLATRFELVEHLRASAASEGVVAELLRLKAEIPPADTESARRAASLMLEAGAIEPAVETLRAAAVEAPDEVGLLAELADAEAAAGLSADARTTLRRALALAPERTDLRDRLAVVDRVLALDPTLPRLRLSTRTRRARQLLSAVLAQTEACVDPSAPPDPVRADAARRARGRAPVNVEAAEQELAMAVQLWAASAACRGGSPNARAIDQILTRVQAAEEPLP